jgi:MSHA biogenesis protein MshL
MECDWLMMKKQRVLIGVFILFSLAFLLSSCTSPVDSVHKQSIHTMNKTLKQSAKTNRDLNRSRQSAIPDAVNMALLNGSVKQGGATSAVHRFDVVVHDVPANTFFLNLSKKTSDNIVVASGVKGSISLNLKNVSLEEVLQEVRRVYGFEYQHTSAGYDITLPHLETRVYLVDHLAVSREGQSKISVTSNKFGSIRKDRSSVKDPSIVTANTEQFWDSLRHTLKVMIAQKSSAEGTPSFSVNPSTGVVVVRADQDVLRSVEHYLKTTQAIASRQVMIEASFLEVELSKGFSYGIDWDAVGMSFSSSGSSSNDLSASASPLVPTGYGNVFKLDESSGKFSIAMKLLSKEGKVSVLSTPRVTTLNNQKAVIKVGRDSYYVTSLSSIDTLADNVSIQSNVGLQPFFSGLALEVIPQIDRYDNVTLYIHPAISLTKSEQTSLTISGQSTEIPTASTSLRETDSVVKAKNGQVIIIGGLMQGLTDVQNSKFVPFEGQKSLDSLSNALGTKDHGAVKTELVVLLKPVVIDSGSWAKELDKTAGKAFRSS